MSAGTVYPARIFGRVLASVILIGLFSTTIGGPSLNPFPQQTREGKPTSAQGFYPADSVTLTERNSVGTEDTEQSSSILTVESSVAYPTTVGRHAPGAGSSPHADQHETFQSRPVEHPADGDINLHLGDPLHVDASAHDEGGSETGSAAEGRMLQSEDTDGSEFLRYTTRAVRAFGGDRAAVSYWIPPARQTGRAIYPPVGVQTALIDGFYPAVTVGLSRESNVFHSEDNEQSDTVLSIRPSIVYRTSLGRHQAQIGVFGIFDRYDKLDTEDRDNFALGAGLNLDLSERLDVNLQAGYVDGSETRGAAGAPPSEFPSPDEFEVLNYGAEAIYGRRSNTMQLAGAIDRDEVRYTNNDQQGRDRNRDEITGRLYYNMGARTDLFAEVDFADIDYIDPSSSLDSTETGLFIGARFDATDATFAEGKIGQLDKDFDDPSQGDFDGVAGLIRVVWQPRPFTGVRLYASRTTEESADPAASFFVSNLLGAAVEHDFTSRWSAYAFLNRTNDEFSDGRDDRLIDFGIGVDYALTQWLSVGARYGKVDKTSNQPGFAFDDDLVSLYFTAVRP